jgi:hypothetical protein
MGYENRFYDPDEQEQIEIDMAKEFVHISDVYALNEALWLALRDERLKAQNQAE